MYKHAYHMANNKGGVGTVKNGYPFQYPAVDRLPDMEVQLANELQRAGPESVPMGTEYSWRLGIRPISLRDKT